MTTTVLTPTPKLKFFDNNGAPAAQYKLFTYQPATTTKLATYVDSVGVTQNTNPIILDFRGECNLWIPPNVAYKYVFASPTDTDPPANPLWSVDNIVSSQLVTLYGGVDTGTLNSYVLNFTANFTSYADGIIIYFIPSHTNTNGPVTLTVNSLGGVVVLNGDGTSLYANQIITNQICGVMYKAGQFLLLTAKNQAGFDAVRNTTVQTFNASTVNDLIVNTLILGEGSAYSVSTGIYTVNTPGIYLFTASVFLQNNGVSNGVLNAVYFSRNNATTGNNVYYFNLGNVQYGGTINAASNPFLVSSAALMSMSAGDTLRIKLDLGAGWTAGFAAMNIGSRFGGIRVE